MRGSFSSIHSGMFLSTINASSHSLHIYLVHVITTLLSVVRQGGFSYHMSYTCPLMRLESDHLFVNFYKVCSNILDIVLRWILILVWSGNLLEVSATLFRDLLFLNASNVFGGVSEWSVNISNCFYARWLLCPVQSNWWSMLLLPGIWLSGRLSEGASFGLLVIPKLPVFLGVFLKFLEGLLRICDWCPRKSTPA